MWFIIIIVVAVIFAIKDVRIHPKLFDVQGNKSEQAVAQVLDIDSKAKQSGKILTNIYVPKSTGDTSEIDIEAIHDRFSNTSICPVCGKNLVLRTIKKGKNAGKQMYGCSNYPKCKYVKKL